jgi:hypothetical protein
VEQGYKRALESVTPGTVKVSDLLKPAPGQAQGLAAFNADWAKTGQSIL